MPAEPAGPATITNRGRALRRPAAAALLLAATLLASGLPSASAKASAGDVIVTRPFAADSTNQAHHDTCPMGFASGTLGWHAASPQTVDVHGTVADHPLPGDTSGTCGEDGYSTRVVFTAYAGGSVVGRAVAYANNGTREFPANLALKARRPIEVVTVQVGRFSLSPPPAPPSGIYWGRARAYQSPVRKI